MEGHDHNVDVQGGGGPVNSRWNPTKEQITMLESLYSQGIRTPSAEQIQQVTSRLRVYGHIEGKNVFYWFQNHKARQRQKQKQENMAYLTQYLHKPHLLHHQPFFVPPPCSNVVCGPYSLPQNELGFYSQTPKVLLPGAVKRRQRTEKTDHKTAGTASYTYKNSAATSYGVFSTSDQYNVVHENGQETLPLFPLHPTGIIREKGSGSAENSVITTTTTTPRSSSDGGGDHEGFGGDHNNKPFFDFFHGSPAVSESDS